MRGKVKGKKVAQYFTVNIQDDYESMKRKLAKEGFSRIKELEKADFILHFANWKQRFDEYYSKPQQA